MNRVIARLTVACAVLWSCVDRTGNLDSFTTASVELDIPELVSVDSGIGSASGAENLSKSEKSASEAQKSTIFSEKNRKKTCTNPKIALTLQPQTPLRRIRKDDTDWKVIVIRG